MGVNNPVTNGYAVYMITSRHALFESITKNPLQKIFIRLNGRDGKSGFAGVPLLFDGPKKNVFFHTDPTVDITVIPFLPDQTMFDFKFLPDRMITSRGDFDALNIHEGSELFFTGMLVLLACVEDRYHVMRFGRVALAPGENLAWHGQSADLFLVETGSIGGNRSSPVYFYFDAENNPDRRQKSPSVLKNAVIMQGAYAEAHESRAVASSSEPPAFSNLGIAAIIPCYKVYEILYSEELLKDRGE